MSTSFFAGAWFVDSPTVTPAITDVTHISKSLTTAFPLLGMMAAGRSKKPCRDLAESACFAWWRRAFA